jgi:hypothetical protein
MNEKDFGAKITHVLNWGLTRIDDDKLARLRIARAKAMEAYREPITVLGLVTVSGPSLDAKYNLIQKPLIWLPMLALVLALAFVGANFFDDPNADIGELDAALLTGELPINAFLDKDFDSWLKGSE